MSATDSSAKRQYEGPAELLRSGVSERDLNDRRDSPDGKSGRERLTEIYGPEGIGWDVHRKPQTAESEAEDLYHAAERRLANEALRNSMAGIGYETDDGVDVSGKVQAYVREPGLVDVVKYPDGEVYHTQNVEDEHRRLLDGEK